MAAFIAQLTFYGYISNIIIDITKNRTPKTKHPVDQFFNAMVSGGAFGLYSDFLIAPFTSPYRYDILKQALGPVASSISDAADVVVGAAHGNKVAKKAFNIMLSWTPFANIFYSRAAMDYLIINEVQEQLSPGYNRRLRRYLHEEGQDFIYHPTKASPF